MDGGKSGFLFFYPFDCFEEFDVERISGQLALEVDERVTGGHRLDQDRVLIAQRNLEDY